MNGKWFIHTLCVEKYSLPSKSDGTKTKTKVREKNRRRRRNSGKKGWRVKKEERKGK